MFNLKFQAHVTSHVLIDRNFFVLKDISVNLHQLFHLNFFDICNIFLKITF